MSSKISSPATARKSSAAGADVNPPRAITPEQLRALRLRAQGLAPRLGLLPAVQAVVGVNAQLLSAMALSLRARVPGMTWAALEARRTEQRDLVRTWCMRGTLHLLPADELEALLG